MIVLVVGYFSQASGKTTLVKRLLEKHKDFLYVKPLSGMNYRDYTSDLPANKGMTRWVSRDLLNIYNDYLSIPTDLNLQILNPFHQIFTPLNVASKWFEDRKDSSANILANYLGSEDVGAVPLGHRFTRPESTEIWLSKPLETDPKTLLGADLFLKVLLEEKIPLEYVSPAQFTSYELAQIVREEGEEIMAYLRTFSSKPLLVESHDNCALPVPLTPTIVVMAALNRVFIYSGDDWLRVIHIIQQPPLDLTVPTIDIFKYLTPLWEGETSELPQILLKYINKE